MEQIMFCSKRFRSVVVSALVMFLALVFTAGIPLEARGSEDPPVLDKFIYLPMVSNPSTTIAGKVMNGESPEVNGLVALMDQGAPGTPADMVANVRTDAAGNFQFSDVPLLRPGYSYFVRFIYQGGNTLFRWETAALFDLKKGQSIILPTFDVAEVVMADPAPNNAVSLPFTFRWAPRPGHGDETYRYFLAETSGSDSFLSPNLGNTGSYTLQAADVARGPNPAPTFAWSIVIGTSDGSTGWSNPRNVSFTNLAR